MDGKTFGRKKTHDVFLLTKRTCREQAEAVPKGPCHPRALLPEARVPGRKRQRRVKPQREQRLRVDFKKPTGE